MSHCHGYLKRQSLDPVTNLYCWNKKYFAFYLTNLELQIHSIAPVINELHTVTNTGNDNNTSIQTPPTLEETISLEGTVGAKEWKVSSPSAGYGFDLLWASGKVWSFLAETKEDCVRWINALKDRAPKLDISPEFGTSMSRIRNDNLNRVRNENDSSFVAELITEVKSSSKMEPLPPSLLDTSFLQDADARYPSTSKLLRADQTRTSFFGDTAPPIQSPLDLKHTFSSEDTVNMFTVRPALYAEDSHATQYGSPLEKAPSRRYPGTATAPTSISLSESFRYYQDKDSKVSSSPMSETSQGSDTYNEPPTTQMYCSPTSTPVIE